MKKVSKKVPKKCCYIISSVILVVVVVTLLSIPFIGVAIGKTSTNENTTESSSEISTIASQSEATTASPFETSSALYETTTASPFETTPALDETTMATTDTITTVALPVCACEPSKQCNTEGISNTFPCKGNETMKDCKWECSRKVDYTCTCLDANKYFATISTGIFTTCFHECKICEFRCANSECIPLSWTCNGENNCGDGSDELNCSAPTTPSNDAQTTPSNANCGEYLFECNDGTCITDQFVCDNGNDCPDGKDEQNCP